MTHTRKGTELAAKLERQRRRDDREAERMMAKLFKAQPEGLDLHRLCTRAHMPTDGRLGRGVERGD